MRSSVLAPWGPVLLMIAGLSLLGCTRSPGDPLVFAAASLADVLEEVEQESGIDVDFHFAGSNGLARQILAAAPADLFLSANRFQMERLIAAGRVERESVIEFAENRLVLIAPAAARDLLAAPWREALLEAPRLALADPEAVPAGVYAREWLEHEGLWSQLQGRVIAMLDVRAALHAVASGSVDIGIVYATDARTTAKVQVIHEVSPLQGPVVRYFAAPIASPEGSIDAEARVFLDYLLSDAARPLFARHGFERHGFPRQGFETERQSPLMNLP